MPAGKGRHPSKNLRFPNEEHAQYIDFSKENYDNGGFPCVRNDVSQYYFYVTLRVIVDLTRFLVGVCSILIGTVELFRPC